MGRGPWAGPLVIGAVILPEETAENAGWLGELTDSKALTAKKREALSEAILREAPAVGLGWVSAGEIDANGLADALKLATRRAVAEVRTSHAPFTEIIIDGTVNFLAGTALEKHVTVLKKADLLIREVSAASIVAKVARDDYMKEISEVYPGYGFEKHVGYGTAAHRAALEKLGVCAEHRRSFKPVGKVAEAAGVGGAADTTGTAAQKNTTKVGQRAEEAVAEYLAGEGQMIIARNFKTKFYEIDIISTKEGRIYFTEVKYRQDAAHGGGLEAVTPQKQKQMEFAAEAFLKYSRCKLKPLLAVASVSGEDYEVEQWFSLD